MCGLFGVLSRDAALERHLIETCHDLQIHRGPDGKGDMTTALGPASLTLAHQRLAIIDLSNAADQPMEDPDGKGVIVFNGELYNYVELRAELEREGQHFRTSSDTEVLLTALQHWGLEDALGRFVWMGAFAWLDRTGESLNLARDPFGEKPLYLFRKAGTLTFASELKTLLKLVDQRFPLNKRVVADFLVHHLTDTTEASIFEGIEQLPAGHFLSITGDAPHVGEPKRYFRASDRPEPAASSIDDFAEEVRHRVSNSVRLRLRSDVPVAVLLSGGLDSSTLAATAVQQEQGERQIQLFSAVSDDPDSDESPFIDRMADHLNRPVTKVRLDVDAASVAKLLELATWHNDHPIPTLGNLYHYLLMQRAQEHGIKVILSGQGGDELFCGYEKYVWLHLFIFMRNRQPLAASKWAWHMRQQRHLMLNRALMVSAKRYVKQMVPSLGDSLGRDLRGEALRDVDPSDLGVGSADIVSRQLLDIEHLSVPPLCHTEDRMSMACSREIRLPFLDPALASLMLSAPVDYKLRNGWTKYALRRAAEGLLPPDITWRKDKRGFNVPDGPLLRGPVGDLIETYMTPDSLVFRHGLIDHELWSRRFEAFRSGRLEASNIAPRELWGPWALECWMRSFEPWIDA